MILIENVEKKLKNIFGKKFIDNYGIFLVLAGVHDVSWIITLVTFAIWVYYLVIFVLTVHYTTYVKVDVPLASEATHYAAIVLNAIAYQIGFRSMMGRIKHFLRFLENETFIYDDTIDIETQKEIAKINATTKKRKLAAPIAATFIGVFCLVNFVIYPVLDGRFSQEENDEHITRSALTVKYSIFDDKTGIGWHLSLLLDSVLIMMYFVMFTAVDVPFICFAEDACKQLDIVNATIRNAHRRARYVFLCKYNFPVKSLKSAEFAECLTFCMKKSVEHHIFAIRCCRKLSHAYTLPVFVVFFSGALLFCDSIMQITSNKFDIGMKFGLIVNMLGDLSHCLMYAYYGERFLRANSDVNEVVYAMGWENSIPAMKPYLSIMQSYTLSTTVRLTALGFFDYNFISFKNLISTGYSYFNLLSASNYKP